MYRDLSGEIPQQLLKTDLLIFLVDRYCISPEGNWLSIGEFVLFSLIVPLAGFCQSLSVIIS